MAAALEPPPQGSGPARRYPQAPLVGVAAAVFDAKGRVLLVKRGRPPRQGAWGLPGGLLELGEKLADGARREVAEECGVEIEVQEIVATFEPMVFDAQGRIEYHYVVIDFWARYRSGDPVAQDDADAVTWSSMADLVHFDTLSAETTEIILRAHALWASDIPGVG